MMDAFQDPVESEYPRRVECPACRRPRDVHAGRIVEHDVVESPLSTDERYACTIRYACPGAHALVSKWVRIR